jgi:uncharacterized protein YjbI with pentapeptide repeats
MKSYHRYEEITAEALLKAYASGRRDFTGIELPEGDSLKSAVLADAIFDRSWIDSVDFSGSMLRGASFHDAHLKLCWFIDADLTGSNFRGAGIDGAVFEKAHMSEASFAGATAYGCTFVEGDTP